MLKPKISILIPCYNVDKYIQKCVESVLSQTLREIEIILVNDGSTDKTLDILKSFAQKDHRIIIVDKANSGYGDSMNKGIDRSSGEYIGIVESDDFVEPNMFEALYTAAKENDADVVKCDFWLYYGERERNIKHNYFTEEECNKLITPSTFDISSLYRRKPSIWSALYRKSFLTANNIRFLPTPGASYQDTSFTFKVFSSMQRAFFLHDAYLHYRQDNSNSSINMIDKKHHCLLAEYEAIENYINSLPVDQQNQLYRDYATAFFDSCLWAYENTSPSLRYSFLLKIQPILRRIIKKIGVRGFNFRHEFWKYNFVSLIAEHPIKWHTFRIVERFEQQGNTYPYQNSGKSLAYTDLNKLKHERDNLANKPKFSIIIPVFNVEWYIRACLESVIHQSYKHIEIICINDGSTDNSLLALEEYARKDDRIVIFNQQKKGVSVARNTGISLAKGEYILFLDSDDWIDVNACETLLSKIELFNQPNIIVFGSEPFPTVPSPSTWLYSVLESEEKYYESVDQETFFDKAYFRPYVWRNCYNREYLVNNNILFKENFEVGEDALFSFEVFIKAKGVAVIPDKIYMYRHYRQNSLMNTISKKPEEWVAEQLRVLTELIKIAKNCGFEPSLKFLTFCLDFVYGCIDNCPNEHKIKYIKKLHRLIHTNDLYTFIDEAAEDYRGFWDYINVTIAHDKYENSLYRKFVKFVSKIIWSSRTQLHKTRDIMHEIGDRHQANLNELKQRYDADHVGQLYTRINELEKQLETMRNDNQANDAIINENLNKIMSILTSPQSDDK